LAADESAIDILLLAGILLQNEVKVKPAGVRAPQLLAPDWPLLFRGGALACES